MLGYLAPGQHVCCDTDACVFLHDPDDPTHKSPDAPPEDLPKGVSFGDALGQWSNELDPGDYIEEIACAGAKTYAYRTKNGKTAVRMKGITLDATNANIFTFNAVKQMVLNSEKLQSAPRHQFINEETLDVETRMISRTVRGTVDSKRCIVGDYDTVPFGGEAPPSRTQPSI